MGGEPPTMRTITVPPYVGMVHGKAQHSTIYALGSGFRGIIPTRYGLHYICLLSTDDFPRCPAPDNLPRTRLIVRRLKMSGSGLAKGWPLSYGPPRNTSLQNG